MLVLAVAWAPGALGDQAGSKARRLQAGLIDLGGSHTCAVLQGGAVRCWGEGSLGELGYGNPDDIGDDEAPGSVGPVKLGRPAVAISAGGFNTCVILKGGAVRCWGFGGFGGLGLGNTKTIGDDEVPASVGPVNLGGRAVAISAGNEHSCALLEGGKVRCWGEGGAGQLGYGNTNNIGDNEAPASVGPVKLGRRAVAISAGDSHTCAILRGGAVRCWGYGAYGALGYGNTNNIGDNEAPASVGPVKLGRPAVAISVGGYHTCAILGGGAVRCWGAGGEGALGYGNAKDIGDDETPASVGPVKLGRPAVAISAGENHTCAILKGGAVRCWGNGKFGELGYANTDSIGDDETPGSVGPVDLGANHKAVAIGTAYAHTCAVLDNGRARCWGRADRGQLGYGNTETIGDNETPGGFGPVALGGRLAAAVGDLSLRVWVSRARARVGQHLALVVKLRDAGPDPVPALVVGLRLPRKLSLLSAKPAKGTYIRRRGRWKVGKIAAGGTIRLKLVVGVRRRGWIAGSVLVRAAGAPDPDSKPANGPGEDDFARFRIRAISGRH